MNYERGKISFYIFLAILLIIIIGGYIFMQYIIKNLDKDVADKNKDVVAQDVRIDQNKEYIYFDEIKLILEDEEIYSKKLIINLEKGKDIESKLNSELKIFNESVKYLSENPLLEDTEFKENKEGIFSLKYRDYEIYQFDKFLSMVVHDSNYDVVQGHEGIKLSVYNFDKTTGLLITEEAILKEFNLTLESIMNQIKEKLTTYQVVEEGMELIKINETMNNLNYGIYVNKIGKLEVAYLVKSTKLDYYDKIILD